MVPVEKHAMYLKLLRMVHGHAMYLKLLRMVHGLYDRSCPARMKFFYGSAFAKLRRTSLCAMNHSQGSDSWQACIMRVLVAHRP